MAEANVEKSRKWQNANVEKVENGRTLMHRPASLPPAVCFLLPRGQSALPSFAHLTILQSKTWNNDDSGNADILQKNKRKKNGAKLLC